MVGHPSWPVLATWSRLMDNEPLQLRLLLFRGIRATQPNTLHQEKRAMGFLFYANLVRFVLRGGLAIVVMEQARSLVRAAGAVLNG
jgi:hypothetical protein